MWDAGPDVLQSAALLHQWLDRLPGVDPGIASKLLARKRCWLVPVHDDAVLRVLRPAGVDSPSLLRLLDVVIWTSS